MYPSWKGFEVKPSRSADREMSELRIYLDDIFQVLEYGQNCARSKRKEGTIEKSLKIRGKMIKVVVVQSETHWSGETVWIITHVGGTREQ